MSLLKPKTKLAKLELELDAEIVTRLRNTLKRITALGDVELLIDKEVQSFLVKLLNKVDGELDKRTSVESS